MDDNRQVGDIVGRIRRRLLVNQWVDPVEVSPRLPNGLRPHVSSNGGVVVGCCMIEISSARPWPMPQKIGVGIRAAAHRISVVVGPPDQPTLAVYVPVRHTDSRPAVLAGGRLFPGVHVAAQIGVDADDQSLSWSVTAGPRAAGGFNIEATARLDRTRATTSEVADIVVGTALGLSPGRRSDRIEAVEMNPRHSTAHAIELIHLDSDFLRSFSSAQPAESLLMTDVDVTWHPVKNSVPRVT